MADIPADIAKMNFEDALKELEGIVRQLEEGKGRLDEAIDSYSRGALLKRHCEAKLAEAEARIDKIVIGPDGSVSTAPANLG